MKHYHPWTMQRLNSVTESMQMNSLATSLPLCSGICIDTQVRSSTHYFSILLEQVLENIFSQQTHNDTHKDWFHDISPSKMSQAQSTL